MNDAHWLLNSNTPKVLLGLPSMSAVLSPVSMCLSGYCLYKISTLSLLIMTFMRQPLMNQGHAIMSNVFETAPIYDRSTTTSHEDASGSKLPNAFMYATGAFMILIASMLAILTFFAIVLNLVVSHANGALNQRFPLTMTSTSLSQ